MASRAALYLQATVGELWRELWGLEPRTTNEGVRRLTRMAPLTESQMFTRAQLGKASRPLAGSKHQK